MINLMLGIRDMNKQKKSYPMSLVPCPRALKYELISIYHIYLFWKGDKNIFIPQNSLYSPLIDIYTTNRI